MGGLHKQKGDKNPVGRPTVMTDGVIAKLEQAFAIDASVEEACSYADIGRNSFYDYLKINPDFSNKIEKLRQKPILKARQAVVQKLDESYSNAMDYLKRKKKAEFGDSTDITSGGEKIIPIFNGQSIQEHNSNQKDIPIKTKD